MNMRSIFIFVILLAYSIHARSLAQIQKRNWVVGVIQENPPLGKDHRGNGIEYELIAAIAKELGVPFSTYPVQNARDGESLLKQDKIDALIAAVKDQPRTKQNFLLTTPYCKSGLGIMVLSSDNSTYMVRDLEGKYVASSINSDARDFFKSFLPSTKVELVPRVLDAYNMLKTKEVVAVADDRIYLDYLAQQDKSVRVLDAYLTEVSYVIAVGKEQTALYNELNRILERLRTTPDVTIPSVMRALMQKYEHPLALPELIVQGAKPIATMPQSTNSPTAKTKLGKAEIGDRLDQLEAKIVEIQKEIRALRQSAQ